MKPVWRTFSIRINPASRKAVGLQTRVPLTPAEWEAFMAWLDEHEDELVEEEVFIPKPRDCDCDPDGPEYHCNGCGLRHPEHKPDCRWLKEDVNL